MLFRTLRIVVCILLCFNMTIAQDNDYSFENNFYKTYGYHFGFGNIDVGVSDYRFIDFGVSFGARYNLFDLSDNVAIGFDVSPELGFFAGELRSSDTGLLAFNIPAFISFNFGAGSTYDSDKDFGIAIKPGLEFIYGPISSGDVDDVDKINFIPVLQISGRFWKRTNSKLRELYLRVGRQSSDNFEDGQMIIYFGWHYLLGY